MYYFKRRFSFIFESNEINPIGLFNSLIFKYSFWVLIKLSWIIHGKIGYCVKSFNDLFERIFSIFKKLNVDISPFVHFFDKSIYVRHCLFNSSNSVLALESCNSAVLISLKEYWPKVEKLVEQGKTKFIGVSNYNVQNLLIVLSIAKIRPIVNEVEFHPYLYQKDLLEFCNLENIKIIAYNPLVKGSYCKERHGKEMEERNLDLFNEEQIIFLSKKYGKTPAQIILNWEIKRGVIPVPGTSNPNRMKENLEAANLKMDDKDYDTLDNFAEQGKELRFCDSEKIYGIDIFA